MTQTYGVAAAGSAEPSVSTATEVDESRALLGGRTSKSHSDRPSPHGRASLTSCISNLSNTIIGSGMLTFPLAMASSGMIPGMITCVLSGSVASFGLYLLSLCAAKTQGRHASFHAVSQLTFPSAAVFFDAAIAAKCFGVSISYLIIIKGLMPKVIASLYHDLTPATTNPPEWTQNGNIWITIFTLVLVPLCFLRHLHSLRHTSYVALFSVAYLVVIVITCYIWPLKGMPEPGEVRLIHFTPNFVSSFPVQVFAFTCAQNLFPVYNELKTNSQTRMNTVIGGSIGAATITYEVIAIFGYLTFGNKVGPNIIAMYPSTSLFIAVGQLAIVILVLFSYPLQVHPCRNCLDKVFNPSHSVPPKSVSTEEEEDDDQSIIGGDEHGHVAHTEMSSFKHNALTAAIVIGGFTVAYLVDDLQIVLSFVGATGSTTISFILPGLFYWKLTRDDPSVSRRMNYGAFALMVYGICVFVFCLGFNIYQVANGGGPAH
ncbi:AAAP amino acid transporter [Pholiota conissans]|uniref:AAAP amino acid transporter n=1 Tax=Pholiota conissans TaxID=109636 RepID=A0A9P6CPS3_9AGAR|nr:AAAP amino acid transporter [Pholiota conissans]